MHVVRPVIGCLGRAVTQIDFGTFVEIFGMDSEALVRARSNRGPSIEVDRGRKNEAVVVIGMFADQVDTTRSAEQPRSRCKALCEALGKLGGWVDTLGKLSQSLHGQVQTIHARAGERMASASLKQQQLGKTRAARHE